MTLQGTPRPGCHPPPPPHPGGAPFYAAMVLYHPAGVEHLASLRVLLDEGLAVVVFDNSEEAELRRAQREGLLELFGTRLLYLDAPEGNIGLAAAYNRIAAQARRDQAARGLFLFDQDSRVAPRPLQLLLESFDLLQGRGGLGVVAGLPLRDDGAPYRIRARRKGGGGGDLVPVLMAPSSFSLLPLAALERVGGFREDFFIDDIDWDFCSRCWRQGLPVYVDRRAGFRHRVGTGDVCVGGKALFPVGAPFRHYYQVRNRILSLRSAGAPLAAMARAVAVRMAVIVVVGLYAGGVGGRLAYAWRGLLDGLKGRGGRLGAISTPPSAPPPASGTAGSP